MSLHKRWCQFRWVSGLIAATSVLRRRLLPALLRLGETLPSEATRGQALRYVEFALNRLQCQVRFFRPGLLLPAYSDPHNHVDSVHASNRH